MPPEPPPLIPRAAWRALFWGQVAVVTALMLMPLPPPAVDTGWDKANHVLAFCGPTVAGLAALRRWRAAAAAWLCAGLLVWGAALEVLQGLLPPRQRDAADWVADAAGVALGLALVVAWRRVISRR